MLAFLSRFRTGITCIVISAVLLSVIAAQIRAPRHPSFLAWGIYALISPFQQATAYVLTGAASIWDEYISLHDVQRENKELKQELARLYGENQKLHERMQLDSGAQYLQSFKEDYEKNFAYEPLEAVVIGAGSGSLPYLQSLIVNKGSLDGVEVNQGVISPYGVVGKVIQVGPSSSLIQLLTDPMFSMASRVQESRVAGMVSGLGRDQICIMEYVRDTDPISVNDRIVSSGLDQIFPKGILIGLVSKVEEAEENVDGKKRNPVGAMPSFKRVEVMPSVNLRSLEWVLIVKWEQSTDIEN